MGNITQILHSVEAMTVLLIALTIVVMVVNVFIFCLALLFNRLLGQMTRLAEVYEDRARLVRREIHLKRQLKRRKGDM